MAFPLVPRFACCCAQRIGQEIFDLAFVMDADGVLLELVHKKDTLDIDMPQAW